MQLDVCCCGWFIHWWCKWNRSLLFSRHKPQWISFYLDCVFAHIYQEIKATDMKYKNRVRSRISNLKDPKNPGLRRNVLARSIDLGRIASMSAEVHAPAAWSLLLMLSWCSELCLCTSLHFTTQSLGFPSSSLLAWCCRFAGNGEWRAEAAEERSHSGGHPRAPDGQNWWHLHRPAAVQQVQEEELHLQPGTLSHMFNTWYTLRYWAHSKILLKINLFTCGTVCLISGGSEKGRVQESMTLYKTLERYPISWMSIKVNEIFPFSS